LTGWAKVMYKMHVNRQNKTIKKYHYFEFPNKIDSVPHFFYSHQQSIYQQYNLHKKEIELSWTNREQFSYHVFWWGIVPSPLALGSPHYSLPDNTIGEQFPQPRHVGSKTINRLQRRLFLFISLLSNSACYQHSKWLNYNIEVT
jgi:hypothetical protein